MLTEEIPADTSSIADFRRATGDDTSSGLLMQAVINGLPGARKDCHPLLVDYWTSERRDQCREWPTVQGSQASCVPEKLRQLEPLKPFIKVTMVLTKCN